jgi:hypothetical protein
MLLITLTGQVSAACVGTDLFQNCTDNSGNSYSVRRFGNSTQMDGYNSNTGSSWSQNSRSIGGTTFHNGTDADGNSWNSTTRRIGGSTFHSGADSDGNSFSKTCTHFGCN